MSHDHGQYGLPDIRQLMTGRPPPQFGGLTVMSGQTQVVESFPVLHHPGLLPLTTPHHYESLGSSGGGVLCTAVAARGGGGSSSTVDFDFGRQESTVMNAARGVVCGLELEGGFGIGGEAAGNGRWPRQETLTLLEIRSRLDFKFKEANQKGPLWDEVSRIMGEENGYHRSGKKCREKFENLYKYYKKTKEGKAGRQDGKHYRFFRQLEAIYGGSNNNNNLNNQPPNSLQETNLGSYNNNNMPLLGHDMIKNQETGHHHHHHFQEHSKNNMISESLSFTNEYSSTELETSSSENVNANNNDDNQDLSAIAFMMSGQNKSNKEKRVVGRSGNWKAKVKEFIDSNMRKLMETQEEWMERMLKAIEVKETERMREEEERRRQEAARLEREQEFWAKERAWLEARDVALMEALKKVSGDSTNSDNNNLGVFCNIMEERSKKLKEDTRTYNYFQQLDLYNSNSQDHHHQQQGQGQGQEQGNGGINMDSNSNVGILHMNNEEMWWDKFGLKLSNDKYHQG